jgi:glycosyltransferase involved in cell wall biosynthesis
MEQQAARQSLGISPQATVLLYVGAMDEYHDLEPLIEALGAVREASVELRVVGDGEDRARCEQKARAVRIQSRFHGYVPHSIVPQYIAAADLCLAPYRTSAFRDGLLPFSTLKVPEYMACGRPVATVPGGAAEKLVRHGVSGFLLPNERSSWMSFLRSMPSRAELASMGQAAMKAVESLGWDKTAKRYLDVCERLVARERAL